MRDFAVVDSVAEGFSGGAPSAAMSLDAASFCAGSATLGGDLGSELRELFSCSLGFNGEVFR